MAAFTSVKALGVACITRYLAARWRGRDPSAHFQAQTNAIQKIAHFQQVLGEIKTPVTDEEAFELTKLLGPDECFGLGLSLVHVIESAPSWPIREAIEIAHSEWVSILENRATDSHS